LLVPLLLCYLVLFLFLLFLGLGLILLAALVSHGVSPLLVPGIFSARAALPPRRCWPTRWVALGSEMTLPMVVADVKRGCPRLLPRGVGGFLPRAKPQAVRDPKCESYPALQRDPELRLAPIREKLRTAKITQRQRWVPGPPRTAGFNLSIKEYESPSWGLRVFRFAARIHGPSLCVLGALAVKTFRIRASYCEGNPACGRRASA